MEYWALNVIANVGYNFKFVYRLLLEPQRWFIEAELNSMGLHEYSIPSRDQRREPSYTFPTKLTFLYQNNTDKVVHLVLDMYILTKTMRACVCVWVD